MSKTPPIVPEQTLLPAVAEKKKPPRQLNFQVNRVFKKHKFSPLSFLISEVIPQLPPEQQATTVIALLPYIYPKIKADDLIRRKKQGMSVQVNTQIVNDPKQPNKQLPPGQAQQSYTLQELLAMAAPDQDDDK